jgi:hypothetical protein
MTQDELSNWIQVVAVLTAVAASIVALSVSAKDRRNAREIADADRAASLHHARLLFELEMATRLLENNNRGGSTDPLERAQLGALTMIGVLGRKRVPRQWDRRVDRNDDGLADLISDPQMPDWKKDAFESQLAVNAILRAIDAEAGQNPESAVATTPPGRRGPARGVARPRT